MIRETFVPVGNASLFVRETGIGHPVIVLHGGPDFSHDYLLPEMDRLAAFCHLIYYDQRGRGRSGAGVEPGDVSMASEVRDLDILREHFGLPACALIGHSYGAILAMRYASQHPGQASHLILMNPAPASYQDWVRFREHRMNERADDLAAMAAIAATAAHQAGDPDAVADRYRIHFRSAFRDPAQRDRLIQRLRAAFTREGILKSRAIEDRLDAETRLSPAYDLLPRLRQLHVPTLVLHGDSDFLPETCPARIAEAIPGAQFIVFRECGHFPYMEQPEDLFDALRDFLLRAARGDRTPGPRDRPWSHGAR